MITTDIYGKTLSDSFNSKIASSAQYIKPKVLINWLDSRHTTGLTVTTNSYHASNAAGDIGYYFNQNQVSNGIQRQSYTWGVAGATDKYGQTIRADGSWFTMPSDLTDNYEYGWWSGSKSTSSVNGTYGGYSFSVNPTLTMQFDSRKCNLIRVVTSEYYGQIGTYTIIVRSSDVGMPNPIFQETVTIPNNTYYFEHYLPNSIGHDTIYRVEIEVITTKNKLDYARIQEVDVIYQTDISDYVMSYDFNKTRDLHESSLPIAGTSSGSLSLVLDNTEKDFNIFNNSSTYGKYMKKDLKLSVTSGWQIIKNNNLYIDKNLRSNISNSSSTISITNTDDIPAGGSGNYFVLTIDPENINKEHVLCSSVDDTYQITIDQRGYAGSIARSHNANAVVRFETFEYPAYSEFYVDEWSASSDSMTVGVNATDWSKFLDEKIITKGFFLDKVTVPDACESLLMKSNFPKANIQSLNRFNLSAKKHGGILHFDFNESTVDRSGNTITVGDGLRARFFAMQANTYNKVSDITADAIDRELSELEKALGEVSFISPSFSTNSASVSSSSLALNLGASGGYSFTGNDGNTYSEYFNCVFDGFYTPTDSGSQYIVVDIAQGGVRVYLDDTLILNEWRLHPVTVGSYFTAESDELLLTAGKPYKIRIESFHKTGQFAIKLKSAVGIYAATDVAPSQTKTIAVLDKIGSKDSDFDPATQDRNKRNNYALYLGGANIGLDGGMSSMPENKSCEVGSDKYIRLPYDLSWDMSNSSNPVYTGSWTIEAYLKTPSVYSNNGEYISTWIDSGTSSTGFELYSNSASNGCKLKTSTGIVTVSSNTALSNSNWSHICVTFDDSIDTLSYFVNGQLKDSEVLTGSISSWLNQDLTFGGRGASYNTSTDSEVAPITIRNVYLDEFVIYNKSLSSQQIANRYTETQMKEVNLYPFLYGSEASIRNIIDEITLGDLGRFYIDELNMARYEHYYRFFESTIDQHANVQSTISDNTHIINADFLVQLQTNKVVVKIAGISSNLVGVQGLWRAPDPTTLAVVNLEANINSTANTMFVSSTMDPPFSKAGYLIIDSEIIKYNNKNPNSFLSLERGQFNTTAANHTANASVREVRYWDIKYDKAPAFQVKNPFITGILFEDPDEIEIIKWVPSSYSAQLAIAASNTVDKGTIVIAEGTNPLTGKVAYTAVAGVPVVITEESSQIQEQVAQLEENIRLYGLKEISIENKFITDTVHAKNLADFIIDKMSTPVPIINITTIPTPKVQLGDKIRISSMDAFDIINGDYWVVSKQYQYSASPSQSLTIRKVV
jgi:hypothetical protein